MLDIIIKILYILPPLYLFYLVVIYFITKVPYANTPESYYDTIFKNVSITSKTKIYELGCGKGKFLFEAEKRFRPAKLVGFDLSPFHIAYDKIKAKIIGSKAEFYLQDFFKADLKDADLIYLFLTPKAVKKIWPIIKKQTKKGSRVIILSDGLPKVKYEKIINMRPGKENSSKLYIYKAA
ncbi:MAG: methyltransferase domain-containing protein [Patescibacteria group bacterium]